MTTSLSHLSDVCDFIKDGTHSSPERTPTGVPVLSAEHVQDGHLSLSTRRFTTQSELDLFQKRLNPRAGDVLLTIVGTIGRTAVLRDSRPFIFQRSVCVLRPRAGIMDSHYLRYALESYAVKRQLIRETKQVAQAGVYLESLNNILVPVPSYAHQERVANQLRTADQLCVARRHALEHSSESLLASAFNELFGGCAATIRAPYVEEIAAKRPNAIRTGPFGSQLLHSEFTNSGVAVLGLDNAVKNRFAWDERRFISPNKYEELVRYTVLPDDILITIMGTCGRCAIVPDNIPLAISTKHLCCITLDSKRCLAKYFHSAFLYDPFVRQQLRRATKGAIMEGLNKEIIKGLRLRLPTLKMQQKWAQFIDRSERLNSLQHEALRQAEHLFQTLLHDAFKGAATDSPPKSAAHHA